MVADEGRLLDQAICQPWAVCGVEADPEHHHGGRASPHARGCLQGAEMRLGTERDHGHARDDLRHAPGALAADGMVARVCSYSRELGHRFHRGARIVRNHALDLRGGGLEL